MVCGKPFFKYIFFFLDLCVALDGLLLLGLGLAVMLKKAPMIKFLEENQLMKAALIFITVLGSVTVIIAFCGFCAAVKESKRMLKRYSLFMVIPVILKITMATLIYLYLFNVITNILSLLVHFPEMKSLLPGLDKLEGCCSSTNNHVQVGISECHIEVPECSEAFVTTSRTLIITIGLAAIVIVADELMALLFGLCLARKVQNRSMEY